jgi:hypothetical protein
MSKIKKEISCVVGTYTNAAGDKKSRYQRIGSIIAGNNGDRLKIDVIPLVQGGWDGWCFINEPKPKEEKYQGLPVDDDSDLPF